MLKKVLILFLLAANTGAMAQEFLEGWKFRQKLMVDHSNGEEHLKDFQLRFVLNTQQLITRGEMQFLGYDIRITEADGITPVCFWFEHFDSDQTEIWVKVPEAKAGSQQTFFLYYGNPVVSSLKNGGCTFLAFDDFLGSEIDPDLWEVVGTSTPVVAGSFITFTASESDSFLRSKKAFPRPVIMEMSVTHTNGKYAAMALIQQSSVFWQGFVLANDQEAQTMQLTATNPEASPCQGPDFYPQIFPESISKATGEWWISWITRNNITAGWPEGEQFQANTLIYEKDLQIALGVSACQLNHSFAGSLSVDWVRLRKFTKNLPEIKLGAPAINPNAPANLQVQPVPLTSNILSTLPRL